MLQSENKTLQMKLLNKNIQAPSQQSQHVAQSAKKHKTLLAGDSMVARAKALSDDAEVLGLPGGSINSLMQYIKQKDKDYERIVLLIGTNDCNSGQTIEEISESYKQLIKEAMLHCPDGLLSISALCPRKDNNEAQEKVERLNRKLELMCSELECTFISNHHAFYLQDGSINDGYLDEKGLHLNKAGMNKLIDILVLKDLIVYSDQSRRLHKLTDPLRNPQHVLPLGAPSINPGKHGHDVPPPNRQGYAAYPPFVWNYGKTTPSTSSNSVPISLPSRLGSTGPPPNAWKYGPPVPTTSDKNAPIVPTSNHNNEAPSSHAWNNGPPIPSTSSNGPAIPPMNKQSSMVQPVKTWNKGPSVPSANVPVVLPNMQRSQVLPPFYTSRYGLPNGKYQTPSRQLYGGRDRDDSDKVIWFSGYKDPLSNYFPCRFELFGRVFHHSEGGYQFNKLWEHELIEEAEQCTNFIIANDAMKHGKKANPPCDAWLLNRVEAMRRVLDSKWEQCPEYRERLMSTGNAILIEDTTHSFWGRGLDGNGLNMLGELHMQKRRDEQVSLWQRDKTQYKHNTHRGPNSATKDYNPPCLYCGVTGHHQDTCRHGTYIQCHDCARWGHKAKYCWYH